MVTGDEGLCHPSLNPNDDIQSRRGQRSGGIMKMTLGESSGHTLISWCFKGFHCGFTGCVKWTIISEAI